MPEISAEGILSRGRGDCLYLGELGPATIWKSNSETAVTLDGTGHAHVYQHGVEVMKEGDFISVVGGYAEETPYPCDADRQAFEIYIIESVNP